MRNDEAADPPWSTYETCICAEVYRTFLITHVSGKHAGKKIGLLLISSERASARASRRISEIRKGNGENEP